MSHDWSVLCGRKPSTSQLALFIVQYLAGTFILRSERQYFLLIFLTHNNPKRIVNIYFCHFWFWTVSFSILAAYFSKILAVYIQVRTVYSPPGPYTLPRPFIFKDCTFYSISILLVDGFALLIQYFKILVHRKNSLQAAACKRWTLNLSAFQFQVYKVSV